MNQDLQAFLESLEPMLTDTAVWDNGRFPLEITYYLCQELPPLAYVSSVRAVVFRGDEVLAVREPDGEYMIAPGGRRETGETVAAALRREILEETGWTFHDPALFSLIHFHHLAPKPDHHPYPYVVESKFRPITETLALLQAPSQLALLETAQLERC